jgi:hypothetical protein
VLQGVYENETLVPGLSLQDVDFVGFNGRCNKSVDTCYAYWVTASLDVSPFIRIIQNECADQKQMLGQDRAQLLNIKAARRFLLEQTQHRIGGFGKAPRNPPGQYFYDDHLFQANYVARYLPFISGPCRTCHYERTWIKTFRFGSMCRRAAKKKDGAASRGCTIQIRSYRKQCTSALGRAIPTVT